MRGRILSRAIQDLYKKLSIKKFSREHIRYTKTTKIIWFSLSLPDVSYTMLIDVKRKENAYISNFEWTEYERVFEQESETLSITVRDFYIKDLDEYSRQLLNRLIEVAINYKNQESIKLYPHEGGCWFCNRKIEDEEESFFDTEFDTHVHKECLIKNLKNNDEEAEIMSYLLTEEERMRLEESSYERE